MNAIENYKRAIENADEHSLKEVFAPRVVLEVPSGERFDHSRDTASHIMSQVANVVPGIRNTHAADAGSGWHFLGFEGQIEGRALQVVDRVHLNEDDKIEQVTVYMRPIPVAQRFSEVVRQRRQAAAARM